MTIDPDRRYIAVGPENTEVDGWRGIDAWDGPPGFDGQPCPLDMASPDVFVDHLFAPVYLRVPRGGDIGTRHRVYPIKLPRGWVAVNAEKRWGVWCWVCERRA